MALRPLYIYKENLYKELVITRSLTESMTKSLTKLITVSLTELKVGKIAK